MLWYYRSRLQQHQWWGLVGAAHHLVPPLGIEPSRNKALVLGASVRRAGGTSTAANRLGPG